ncbi:MAG: allophanate hydrolase, partial [Firmicutes bacterium]|nr:allophanate hydrolase [Bacillota bacterium]
NLYTMSLHTCILCYYTVQSPYGEVHNSLKPELISGGSSSGSAVAVALGLVAFSLGTDTAGSGRVPAALNNLVGYKPSIGAWSSAGLVPACASLDCITVFANNIDDAYRVDRAARGKSEIDKWSRSFKAPKPEMPKTIYILENPEFYGAYKNEYKSAWEKSVSRIKETGAQIKYDNGEIYSAAASLLYGGPWVAERWADLKEFVTSHSGEVFPVTETILKGACKSEYDAASVFQAMHKLQRYKKEVREKLADAVIIMPTCGGTWTRGEVRANPIETNNDMGRYTNHCNLLDLAAIALPAENAAESLPFGITAFSLCDNEDYLKGFAEGFVKSERVEIAVCGLHMRGYALEYQLKSVDAKFVRTDKTSNNYKMYRMNTNPPKPYLAASDNGNEIEVEVWSIPKNRLCDFMSCIPAPLGLGRITLRDKSEIIGFIGRGADKISGEDITKFGGWRYAG